MCGISGIIDHEGVKPSELLKMSAILKHRGLDDEGFSIYSNSGKNSLYRGNETVSQLSKLNHISEAVPSVDSQVGFMHRRLSIIDLSEFGHQPMNYKNGKISIVYNGEIYNYKEIRSNLSFLGYSFTTDSDTEVILAAYSEWGMDCVSRFVGMWAFAILDADKNQLFLSRDRFGIKPLYYSYNNKKFAFASEIKALLELDFVRHEADMDRVLEYISFGATSNPSANLFRDVNCLPPAHQLTINISTLKIEIKRYYDLQEQVENYQFRKEDKFSSFNELLNNSVELHLRSDVPVGSALSGGLDSGTLVTLASAKMKGHVFKTFTAAYHEKEIDESHYAKLVTGPLTNVEPNYIYPSAEGYWKDIDKLTWHQDLPINSSSMFAQWEVMKLAKQEHIKVLLDGQGSDEILGGYYNFAGIHLVELLKRAKFISFYSERKNLKENFTSNIDTAFGRAAYYFLPETIQRSIRARKRIGMGLISNEYADKLEKISVPARGGKSYKELSLLSMQFSLQDLLRYEDRNSMAFSIESRVPFLDHRLVEYCIALDNEWKIKNGWTKYILRKAMEPSMDKDVIWRKDKMGFLTPQKKWKENSSKELTVFINETKIPDFLNKEYISKLCSADVNDNSHLSEFWKMISFLKWASIYKVNFK